jgi:hydrogenase large subunit
VRLLDGEIVVSRRPGLPVLPGRDYQAVVPSTWNAGPRDAKGQEGAYEAARHALHDPKQPIEILRTIHSFDPCLACAVHVVGEKGNELIRVNTAPALSM